MNIAYFPNQIALNAEPVLQAFIAGCKSLGITCTPNSQTADAAVIWSVLWQGRMRQNLSVYDHYRNQGKSVFILEVGSLIRGHTWKLSVNNITNQGIYPTDAPYTARNLNIALKEPKTQRNPEILIATQHEISLQWADLPSTNTWLHQTIEEIRKYTNRPIVVRPHPRGTLRRPVIPGVKIEQPRKIPNSHDRYDINFDYHCVVNYNSGVGLQSVIEGTPVITGPTSLAHEISGNFQNIEGITLPNRTKWFEKILHTEWLVEELAQGIPQRRLLDKI